MSILRVRDKNGVVHEVLVLKGDPGYTPQKGVDYYTDAEREALIAELGARDVDQELDQNSTRAVANHVVTKKLNDVEERLASAETSIFFYGNNIHNISTNLNEFEQQLPDIKKAATAATDSAADAHLRIDRAPNTFANALKGRASGAVVAVNDVSPVEHDVAVVLSSDTVTDFSTVTVKRYGKNLCPVNTAGKTSDGITYTPNDDGTITVSGTATAESYFDVVLSSNVCPRVPIGTSLYISGCPSGGSSGTYFLYLPWVGWYDYGKGFSTTLSSEAQATNWRQSMRIVVKAGVTMDNLIFKPQVELSRYSEYEPYTEPTTHTASADGTVEGVKSLSPSMTLISNTDGVMITAEYNKDTNAVIGGLLERISALEAAVINNT